MGIHCDCATYFQVDRVSVCVCVVVVAPFLKAVTSYLASSLARDNNQSKHFCRLYNQFGCIHTWFGVLLEPCRVVLHIVNGERHELDMERAAAGCGKNTEASLKMKRESCIFAAVPNLMRMQLYF